MSERYQERLRQPPDSNNTQWMREVADTVNKLPPQVEFDYPTPEENVPAVPGTIGSNVDGTLWIKETGSGDTGWSSLVTTGALDVLGEHLHDDIHRHSGYGGFGVSEGAWEQDDIPDDPSFTTLLGWTFEMPLPGNPQHVISDLSEAKITFLERGVYGVWGQFSFSGDANTAFHIHIFKNSSITQGGTNRKLGAGGDVGSCSVTGLGTFEKGDFIVPKVHVVTGQGDALTLTEGQLWVGLLDADF